MFFPSDYALNFHVECVSQVTVCLLYTSYEYQQAVAAHTGWKYEYVEGSWAELMSMLKNGQIDLCLLYTSRCV